MIILLMYLCKTIVYKRKPIDCVKRTFQPEDYYNEDTWKGGIYNGFLNVSGIFYLTDKCSSGYQPNSDSYGQRK